MNKFRSNIEKMVVAVEQSSLVSEDLGNFASQIRAHIEMDKKEEQKDDGLPPETFYPGLAVYIASGPFGGNYGKFVKLVKTPFDDLVALVALDEGADMPIETKVSDLRLTS